MDTVKAYSRFYLALGIVGLVSAILVVMIMLSGCGTGPEYTPPAKCTDVFTQSFCDSITGANGKDGTDGQQGIQGPAGPAGVNGTNGNDGQTGKQGEAGNDGLNGSDGSNGTSCTVTQVYDTTDVLQQANQEPQQVLTLLKDTGKRINSANDDPAGLNIDSIGALIQCTDSTSAMVYNGKDGINGVDAIQEVIDPCGKQGQFDEVLLRFSDNSLYAIYYTGTLAFMTIISDGSYVTTDGTGCNFKVDGGKVIW